MIGEDDNPSFLYGGEESLPHSFSDQDMPFLFGDDSEEGFDLPEETVRRAPHRTSGSKRSRAAEVHNLSEKRRRSKINEKMKALQNLVPNSNKTDKASMLDEAIEYLKQLQLQVQMLSMRNGLTSLPMFLPGSLPPMQASHLCMSLGDSASAMNMGALGLVPLNQNPSAHSSFHLRTQSTSSHQTVIIPSENISAPETSFLLEPSQPHHRSFQLQVPHQELFAETMASRQQFHSPRSTRTLAENAIKAMDAVGSLHFEGKTSSTLEDDEPLRNVLPKDLPYSNPIFSQHFDAWRQEEDLPKMASS